MHLSKLVPHCDKRIAWYSSIQSEMTIPLKPTRVSNSPGSSWSGLDLKEMSFIIRELCQKAQYTSSCLLHRKLVVQNPAHLVIWGSDRQTVFFLPANSVVPAGKLSCQNFTSPQRNVNINQRTMESHDYMITVCMKGQQPQWSSQNQVVEIK